MLLSLGLSPCTSLVLSLDQYQDYMQPDGRLKHLMLSFLFSRETALKATGSKGIEPAMEWLISHEDDPVGEAVTENSSDAAANSGEPAAEAKSLKCNE